MNSVVSCIIKVGEIERSLRERAQEHDKSVKAGDSKSAVGQHQMKTGHVIISIPAIEGVRVTDNEPRNTHRNVKEAIHIKL